MRDRNEILADVVDELERAEKVHPTWPRDPIHGVAVMVEEAGESMQAAIDVVYSCADVSLLERELVQTAAMCVRMLEHTGELKPRFGVGFRTN